MKNIFIFIFLFTAFPALLSAQEAPDSTSVTYEDRNGVFFSVTRNFYSSGIIVTEEKPIGTDTLTIINAMMLPAFYAATQHAERAAIVARGGRVARQINAASANLQATFGRDYFGITNATLIGEFLPTDTTGQLTDAAYTMRVDGTPIPVTLRRSATGQLVMRQGATSFRVDIVSRNWIRIRRYQGTEALAADGWIDLFQERNGAYISEDLKYQLRK